MTEIGAPRPVTLPVMPTVPATAAVCPYLLASDGRWRASTPAREHRCTVVSPPAVLAAEKQRRLCLSPDHVGCSTYMAAVADAQGAVEIEGTDARPDGRRRGRVVTRTAPLVLDHGRLAIGVPALRAERSASQSGLVALMGIAFVAIVLARLSGGGPNITPAAGVASASPSHAVSAAPSVAPVASDVPTRTLVPTEVQPTPAPGGASAAPSAAAGPTTYKVKSGDTLGGIAQKFNTTVAVLQQLNGIDNPRLLHVGQVLDLP